MHGAIRGLGVSVGGTSRPAGFLVIVMFRGLVHLLVKLVGLSLNFTVAGATIVMGATMLAAIESGWPSNRSVVFINRE